MRVDIISTINYTSLVTHEKYIMGFRIAVDVDLVTFNSDHLWFDWLCHQYGYNPFLPESEWSPNIGHDTHLQPILTLLSVKSAYHGQLPYDLSYLWRSPHDYDNMITTSHDDLRSIDPYDFWRNEGIYDTVTPVERSVWALTKLSELGHDIIFVTHNKGNHSRSKYNALNRFFGHINFSYIVTKEKYLVDCSIIIDDRLEFLYKCKNRVKFMFDTAYDQAPQTVEQVDAFHTLTNTIPRVGWSEIVDSITSKYFNTEVAYERLPEYAKEVKLTKYST